MAPIRAIFFVLGHFLLWSEAKILPALSQSYMKDKGNLDITHCRRSAQCFPVNQTTCLGGKLPHNHTSSDITGLSMHHTLDRLQMLKNLYRVPKCWAVIQPVLCALFFPRCDPNTGLMDLPTHEMCKVVLHPCRILMSKIQEQLPYFDCEDKGLFPQDCKEANEVKERFNTSGGQCVFPLVPTDNSYYDGVDGCGLQCADPTMNESEREHIRNMVLWGAGIALASNVFALLSFILDWKSANNYPSLIIFYINFCFAISNTGWLVQFVPDALEDIVCRKDGTLRLSEPSSGENLSCVIVFVMVYYFLMAACVWFVILTYAWHLRFKTLDKIQTRLDKKAAYFHLVAWSLPSVLTIVVMAVSEIDGNFTSGICFVGYTNRTARLGFVVIPVLVCALIGAYFLFRVLATLIGIKIGSNQIISNRASAKIRCTIIRVGLFLVLSAVIVIISLICHVYEVNHDDEWKRSLKKFIICRLNPFENTECKMSARPSIAMIQLHLLAMFLSGILMSFWVWTSSTRETWRRALAKFICRKTEDRGTLKKHKIIAQAYTNRQKLNDEGRLSINIHETHTDPVGLNFELNSLESQDFSTTWAAALPKFVTRRGALIDATTESNSSSYRRRNSYDSEISYSVRRVSVESRRHSLDSQISVQISELTATRTTTGVSRKHGSSRRRRRRDYGRTRRPQRKASSTSQESQMGMQILTALAVGNPNMLPYLWQRRPGNAGLTGSAGANNFPMIEPVPSDDNDTTNEAVVDKYESVDVTGGRLCALGQGIQSLRARDTDSDVEKKRKPNARRRLDSASSGRRRQRDSYCSDSRRSTRKRSSGRKSEEVARSRDSATSKKKRFSEADAKGRYSACKTEDYSEEDTSSSQKSDSEDENTKCSKWTKPKASVDAATQVSSQEIATQTELPPPVQASQGTQMTPPYHIRLINKTLGNSAIPPSKSSGLKCSDSWLSVHEAM